MYRILLLLLALTAAATPARADMTAIYQNPLLELTLTIQVADNGDARLHFSHQEWRLQIVGGEAYAVHPRPGGTARVASVSNLERLIAELRPSLPPVAPSLNNMRMVQRGEVTILGYRGTAFYRGPAPPPGLPDLPTLVVTRDPSLAALGHTLLQWIDLSLSPYRITGATIPLYFVRMREAIGDGTPLVFIGFALVSIDRSPIDPALLRLPAPPVTLEELRAGGMPNLS